MTLETLRGAVARGWCHEGNTHKEMDVILAEAIVEEVITLLLEEGASIAIAGAQHAV